MATSIPGASAPTYAPYPSEQAARVHLLKQQGESPAAIAAILSLPVATVDGYLGIAAPQTAAIPVPALTPVPAQNGAVKLGVSLFA